MINILLIWFETVHLYSLNTLHRIAQIMCIQFLWSVWLQCMLGGYVIVADCMQLIIAPQWVTKPLFSDLGLALHGHSSDIPYPCCAGLFYMFRAQHWWAVLKCTHIHTWQEYPAILKNSASIQSLVNIYSVFSGLETILSQHSVTCVIVFSHHSASILWYTFSICTGHQASRITRHALYIPAILNTSAGSASIQRTLRQHWPTYYQH